MAQKRGVVMEGRMIGRAALAARRPLDIAYAPDAEARAVLAAGLGVDVLRRPRLRGVLRPEGAEDWLLEAQVTARVTQPCVVTLEPVTTRIEARAQRRYLSRAPSPPPGESEMPDDDTAEALGQVIDLHAVMAEVLALEIPQWPRAEGAELGAVEHGPPGGGPPDETAAHPLAGLADIVRRTKK